MTLREHLTMPASGSMFYVANDCKNKTNMKVAACNINIKIHQLFSNSGFLMSEWPLHSGNSKGTWHELALG